MNQQTRMRLLVMVLRLAGVVTVSAFAAIFLPVEWMAAAHRWLGLGELPRSPVFDYLARSAAALYGFHGVLLLLISRDPLQYRDIVSYIGWMNVAFGLIIAGIDLHAGLPLLWTLGEGPPIVALGIVVTFLNKSDAKESGY